ncbi:hypothetical protein EMCRGX_G027188 [Ephydatia muelleri]
MFMPELILSGGTASCYPGMALVIFIAQDWNDAEAIHLYTDASSTLGFGAFFNGTWIRGDWQPHRQLARCSIPWQELFTILAAALTWGHLLSGQSQLHRVPGAPPMMAELHRRCTVTQPRVMFLLSCPSGTPRTNITSPGTTTDTVRNIA